MSQPMPAAVTFPHASLAFVCGLFLSACGGGGAVSEESDDGPPDFSGVMSPAEFAALDGERGVVTNLAGASPGLTMIAPLNSTKIHLVDLAGETVHTWNTDGSPGAMQYLLADGSLLRAAREDDDPKFHGGGIGGRLQRIAPDGEVLWQHRVADEAHQQHHDFEPLPNGHLLVIAWERLSREEAVALGRYPEAVGDDGWWPDTVLELAPKPERGAEVVWEWHAKDHLIQDRDPELANYGDPADFPGRIDVNYDFDPDAVQTAEELEEQRVLDEQMAALGYGGASDDDGAEVPEETQEEEPYEPDPDWMHTNGISYHPALDLIALSSPELCEVFVIDHSTTTAEAAGSSGGRHGRGGDLLWRWGNPENYGRGGEDDKRLGYQHDPTWIGGADDPRLLVFNNNAGRDEETCSAVLELDLPFEGGRFLAVADGPCGPVEPSWSYQDADKFFSAFISGAQRLPSGHTLICSGAPGHVFEVTPAGEVVWDYFNPHGGDVDPPEHAGKAPPLALFRAQRYSPDHPGVAVLRNH